ncbi:glycosyltransferase [Hyphomonas sp. CY54-11-8]|uniref:glycosyltransferase n=1 Tax=Hyphomonas sp. CY54-11-8 TaxID=1280944 RepID=UPI0009DD8A55|nr:glycosyltransferase [Hyphomonas sp. CY54-11-8]
MMLPNPVNSKMQLNQIESNLESYNAADLKVAIVSANLSRMAGGILPIMQHHGKELKRLGINVTAFGSGNIPSTEDLNGWGDVPIVVKRPWMEKFAFAPGLFESINRADPDLVHQHALWQYPSVAVSTWRRKLRKPVIISTQGMLEPWALSHSRAKKRIAEILFERQNLANASVIHCSPAEVPGVRAFGLKNPIAVLPNGAVLPDKKNLPRPEFLPNDGRNTLLFLGRLHPKKGIIETLSGFANFKKLTPEIASRWQLVVAGWDEGDHLKQLLYEVENLGLQNDVVFSGPQFGEDKDALLAWSKAFVLASYSEGFPMAVLEAWANALPVFMTRECNILEGFQHGAAVEITTSPGNIATAFAEHLGAANLAEMGSRGRSLVTERFTWPVITKEILAVYKWALGSGPKPDCIDIS